MADEEFKRYFFAESCPKLLQKLSLDDGMKCFLEWKDQYELYLREYEGWCSHYGTNFRGVARFIGFGARLHALYLLDRQLLDVLMDRMEEENFQGMDHETFVQELLDIFEEESQDDEDLDEEFDEEEEDDVALEDLEFDEEEQDEIALDDLNIISDPMVDPMADILADPMAIPLPNPLPDPLPDPMADPLPSPLPDPLADPLPDPLADHLPDPIPPDTLADHLPDPIPPDTSVDHS